MPSIFGCLCTQRRTHKWISKILSHFVVCWDWLSLCLLLLRFLSTFRGVSFLFRQMPVETQYSSLSVERQRVNFNRSVTYRYLHCSSALWQLQPDAPVVTASRVSNPICQKKSLLLLREHQNENYRNADGRSIHTNILPCNLRQQGWLSAMIGVSANPVLSTSRHQMKPFPT